MKGLFIAIILFLGVFLLGFYLIRNNVGDIRPAILPPEDSSISQVNTMPVDLPLSLPEGFSIGFYAQNLGGVRDLEFSPGGTLLASVTSGGKVIALTKSNGNVEIKEVLSGLDRPHGIAFREGKLFVAEETRLARYNWDEQVLTASLDKVLFNLPSSEGGHFTRSIVFDNSGRLYISIGSTCNVCNEENPRHAAVLVTNAEGDNPQILAEGLRNSVFMAVNPATSEVWATEMGRDFLGDNLPPDEINILKEGEDYGWPDCYGSRVADRNFNPNANCANTEPSIFKIPAHSAPLGLTFINSPQFPDNWQGDLLVAYHGSWNRSVPTGYKIIRMNVEGDRITESEDFITGFLQNSQALGRPVDLVFDQEGDLYISDDKRGAVYIVSKK